jgi:hypothetical protein
VLEDGKASLKAFQYDLRLERIVTASLLKGDDFPLALDHPTSLLHMALGHGAAIFDHG